MAKLVGSGKHTYEPHEDWAILPQGWEMPAAAVAVDSRDRVYCFNRSPDRPIAVFDRDGNYLRAWGEGLFAFAHAIYVDHGDNVWVVERNHGQVMKFTPTGKLLLTIGTKGYRSDTGVDPTYFGSDGYKQVTRPGGPFNMPAGIAVAPSGDVFVADGYANCRVHRFSPKGEHILSWGEPGASPGQFRIPHGVWIDKKGRVLVSDRENDRVQVFTQEGKLLGIWPTRLIGPAVIYVDNEDIAYVAEHNGGDISVLTLDGDLLARWGSPSFRSCHGVWADSRGDLYVVQPTGRGGGSTSRTVVKYIRTR
ncbi:MAG: hypothetical protein HY531_03000 [Chloroflexi bacterium]|nr:hypothetical protein [Chloroflexota bacterium]